MIMTCRMGSASPAESVDDVLWTPLSVPLSNQTPEIHDKIEEIKGRPANNKCDTTTVTSFAARARSLVKGGLAELLSRITKVIIIIAFGIRRSS